MIYICVLAVLYDHNICMSCVCHFSWMGICIHMPGNIYSSGVTLERIDRDTFLGIMW